MCERERVRGRMRVVCEREGESECGREERECERLRECESVCEGERERERECVWEGEIV